MASDESGPETDDRFALGPSTVFGAGQGVFTRVPLAVGDELEIVGVKIAAHSPSDLCTAFADQHKFRLGGQLLIPLGYGGMVNHSDQPNMIKVIDGDRLVLRALRPIAAGEELFHAYNEEAQKRLGLRS